MFKKLLMLAVYLIISTAAIAQQPESVRIHYMNDNPSIDGTMESGEWESAQAMELRDTSGGNEYKHRTIVHVGYNTDWLFIAFECYDTDLKGLQSHATKRDSDLDKDDAVYFSISPAAGGPVYQFGVSSSGVQFDSLGQDPKWDYYWVSAVKNHTRSWSVEAAVPMSAFGEMFTQQAASWEAGFIRVRHPQGPDTEITSWSPTGASTNPPALYGTLTGLAARSSVNVMHRTILLEIPTKLRTTGNRVVAYLHNPTDQPLSVRLNLINLDDFSLAWRSEALDLDAGKNLPVRVILPQLTDQPQNFQIVATPALEPRRVISASKIVALSTAPVLKSTF